MTVTRDTGDTDRRHHAMPAVAFPPDQQPARVHLLLQVDPAMIGEAARHVAAVAGVRSAVRTTGPYDVIAVAEAVTEAELTTILSRVRNARGLCRLAVCRA